MKRASLAILPLLLTGCPDLVNDPLPMSYSTEVSVIAPGQGDEYGPELFPWQADDEWLYFGQSDYLFVRPSQESISTNGMQSTVTRFATAGITSDHFIRVDSSAVRDFGSQFKWWPCSLVRLHFPVRVGKRWKVEDPYADTRMEATVESLEPVETPMGVYQALKVHYFIRNAADEERMHQWMWFVPGIGMVRWQHQWGWAAGSEPSANDWLLRHFTVAGYEEERAAARIR